MCGARLKVIFREKLLVEHLVVKVYIYQNQKTQHQSLSILGGKIEIPLHKKLMINTDQNKDFKYDNVVRVNI
jgi:hypothetical protein